MRMYCLSVQCVVLLDDLAMLGPQKAAVVATTCLLILSMAIIFCCLRSNRILHGLVLAALSCWSAHQLTMVAMHRQSDVELDATVSTVDGCDGGVDRYASDCTQLYAQGHALLGNQLIFGLAVASMATHLQLSSCSGGPSRCYIHLSAQGGLDRLRVALPAIDLALAPCLLVARLPTNASSDDNGHLRKSTVLELTGREPLLAKGARYGPVGVLDSSGRARLKRSIFDHTWRACAMPSALRARPGGISDVHSTVTLLGGYSNFCRTAGAVRLREMPSGHFWTSMRHRATDLGMRQNATFVPRQHDLCMHLRGRDVELRSSAETPGRRSALDAAAKIAHLAHLSSIFVAAKYESLRRRAQKHHHLRHLKLEGVSDFDPEASKLQPYSDLLTLKSCAIIVAEEPPSRGTFTLAAMLMGGLSPCPELSRLVNASAWQILCRRSAAIVQRHFIAGHSEDAFGHPVASDACQGITPDSRID